MNSKNRVYEVCLVAFFLITTSACTSTGNRSADFEDLDVDLLAVLTEPEQINSDDKQKDAEMVSEYQSQTEVGETQLVEGIADPFGEVFGGSTDSELAGEEQESDSEPSLSFDTPATLENDSEKKDGTDMTNTENGDKKDLSMEIIKGSDNIERIEESADAGLMLASADAILTDVPAPVTETVEIKAEDQPAILESDLDEQQSIEFLLEGASSEKPATSDELIQNRESGESDDALLMAAIGDDNSNLEDEADLVFENEIQDDFISDIIVGESTGNKKQANYLAQTTFEPDSDVPVEIEANETWDMNLEQVIAQTQGDFLPVSDSSSDLQIASAPVSAPAAVKASEITIPTTMLASVQIASAAPVQSAPLPEDEELQADNDNFEDISIAMLTGDSSESEVIVPETAFLVASTAIVVPEIKEIKNIQTNHSENHIASIDATFVNKPEMTAISKQVVPALVKRLDPQSMHQRLIQSPGTIAYSGKKASSSATSEKMVKVMIDGKPAVVAIRKPQTANLAIVKKTVKVNSLVKIASVQAEFVTKSVASVQSVKSVKSQIKVENSDFRLVLNKTAPATLTTSKRAAPTNTNDDAGHQHRTAFDITNKILLPKREDVNFG